MSSRGKQFILACLIPAGILLGMTVMPLYTLVSGEEVILRTIPVDPTDLFRGDYVILRYEAEEVPASMVSKEVRRELEKGHSAVEVYVALKQEDGFHVPEKVTLKKPESGLYLKGKLNYITTSWDGKLDGEETAYLSYTLDKYFVEDNTGLELEEASRDGNILAKVKVKNGYAYLVDVSVIQ
jgi:uncharacterized membrane-anchored protein